MLKVRNWKFNVIESIESNIEKEIPRSGKGYTPIAVLIKLAQRIRVFYRDSQPRWNGFVTLTKIMRVVLEISVYCNESI